MPTYEYKCLSCSYKFEVFQSMTSQPIEICPKCGGKVKRLIGTGAGPIFKGNGFYQTDYKNSGKPASADFKKSEKKSTNDSSNKNATDKK